jgi:hypothetical protein
MANNRLYLKSNHTGERILIAKYYPSTGWYPRSEQWQNVQRFFERHSFGNGITWKQAKQDRIKARGGMYDSNSFEIEFEE